MKKNTIPPQCSAWEKKQKKKYFSLFILLFSLTVSAQTNLSTAENYVYTKNCLDADCIKKAETVQYFDGLGRPVQSIAIKATPLGRDVVMSVEYDSKGREAKSYLPVPQAGTANGAIYTDPLGNASAAGYGNERIYAEKIYDNVYTGRVNQMVSAGTVWSQKPVNMGYDTNADGEVKKYTISTEWTEGRTNSSITLAGSYAANQLMKNSVTDQDGNTTTEFQNGEGQTVLVRKNDGLQNVDTYYLYNEYGQQAYVIPPLAVADTVPDQTVLDKLCYQYRYDGLGRMVEKKLPGKGWEYIVYDRQDRVVAVQDALIRTKGQWMYTKYDRFGRVAFTGISTGGLRTLEQTAAENFGSNNVTRTSEVFFNREGMDVYYDPNTTYPTMGWVKILAVNYYDTYPAYSFNPSFPGTVLGQAVMTDAFNASVNTQAMPTLSLVKNIEDDNWTKSYVYYDKKARVVGTYIINHLGGYTKTETEMDFAGVARQTKVYHKRLSTDTERVISQSFEYDHQNRMMKHRHQVGSGPVELLTENTYNELSQISNKKVGGGLESIDYQYDIRGALTKINDPVALGTKLFGYALKYQNPEYANVAPGRSNGNISEIDWKSASDGILKRYSYVYDPLNRLKDAVYAEPGATAPHNNYYNEYMTYDLQGNIKTLQRNAFPVTGNTASMVDDLMYQYTGNRLDKVIENAMNDTGYEGGNNLIDYDDNGNMTTMKDKGIENIGYNFLSLPDSYAITQNSILGTSSYRLDYLYRADGTKLRKTYFKAASGRGSSSTTRIADYLDGFQYSYYEGGGLCLTCKTETAFEEQAYKNVNKIPVIGGPPEWKLDFVPTAEGFYSFEENRYIYQYKDHLGNTRVSFARNSAGASEILDTGNYYAFGLNHIGGNGLNSSGFGSWQSYKYNGKELQETGMYDYGARMYMSDLGRWGVIDPLAEISRRFSPYNYAVNNPVMFIDPDGRKVMPYRGPVSEYPSQPMGGMLGFLAGGGVPNRSGILRFLGYEDDMGAFFFEMEKLARRDEGGGGNGSMTFTGVAMINLLQNFFGNDGSVSGLFSMVEQLEKAGFKDPANTKAKFSDLSVLLEKVPALAELFGATKSEFIDNTGGKTPNKTVYEKIWINMNNIENILKLAFTAGHEMNHSFADLFFRDKFSEITKQSKSSIPFRNSFGFFQEAMGLSWEINLGSERYGNRTGLQAAEFFYGPNGLGYSQKSVDTVKTYFYDLKTAWNLMYKSKLK